MTYMRKYNKYSRKLQIIVLGAFLLSCFNTASAEDETARKNYAQASEKKAEDTQFAIDSLLKTLEEKARQEEEELRRAEDIASYLQRAEVEFNAGNFDAARNYAKKALELDKGSRVIQMLLTRIDEAEIASKEMVQIEKEEAGTPSEDAAKYLVKAQEELNSDNFDGARGYIQKALELEGDNQRARQLLTQVDASERAYKEEQRILEEEKAQAIQEKLKQAETLNAYLKEAETYLNKDEFDNARTYANKALEINRTSSEARSLLTRIDAAEKAYEEEQKMLKREESATIEEIQKKAEMLAGYIQKSEEALEKNNFDSARSYAEKALAIDERNRWAQDLLAKISREQKAQEEELKRLKEEEAARTKREEEAKRREEARRKEEMAAQAKRITGYLTSAKEQLDRQRFDSARSYVKRALSLDGNSPSAKALLNEIDKEENAYIEAQEESKRKALEEERARKAAEERAREERELVRRAEKIAGYLQQAERKLAENSFDRARNYAQSALRVDANSKSAQEMLKEIDRAQEKHDEELKRAAQLEAARKKQEEEARRKELEERELKRRAEKIAGYLTSAEEQLSKENFDRAKSYANRALMVDENSNDAKALLKEIDVKEQAHEKELERLKEEEKKLEMQREEERRKRKAEEEAKRRAARIEGYLARARLQLQNNKFDSARSYAERALSVDKTSSETQMLLSEIDKNEKSYQDEQRRLKMEEEAKKAEEARLKQEKEAQKRAEKVAGYLGKAKEQLDKNYFDRARSYAKRALATDENSKDAQDLLAQIDQAEKALEEEKKRPKEEEIEKEKQEEQPRQMLEEGSEQKKQALEEEKKKKEEEAIAKKKEKEAAKKEARLKYNETKAQKYIEKAEKEFSKKDYSDARRYAHKAQTFSPESQEIADLICRIDDEEIFTNRKKEEVEREKRIEKALKKTQAMKPKDDPFDKYDEGKSWIDHITGLWKKKTYKLGDVQEGRTYTIDKCVQLALQRSQRLVMSDRQVKLAEMRVWETRRDLLPEVTGRIERTTGKMRIRHYQGEKYQLGIKQTIFDGMGSWYSLRQMQANLAITKLEREKIKNEIIADTKTAYYSLDKAVKALEVQRKHKKMTDRLYDLTEKSYQKELVSRVEYLNVKGYSLGANFQFISAEEDVSLAELILFQAMNMEPEQYIKIRPVEKPRDMLSIGLENCYQLAFANRPDFKIKEKTIEYYDFERKMMKAKGWPKITFDGSFGSAYETFQPTEDETERRGLSPEWYAGVKGSVPIFGNTFEYNYVREQWAPVVSSVHGTESATSYFNFKLLDDLAYFSNLEDSRAGFESAKYEYLKSKDDITVEVKESYFKYRKALLSIDVAKAKVDHQTMYVDVLEERRSYGETEASKVLEEAEKLAVEEYGMVAADTAYYLALTDLNKAIGIPDYFKPEYENKEYVEWNTGVEERKAFEENEKIEAEKAALEAKKKAKEEALVVRRAERIANYLVQAQTYLDKKSFSSAQKYVHKALNLDPENETAKRLLDDIEKAKQDQ